VEDGEQVDEDIGREFNINNNIKKEDIPDNNKKIDG
jgi:hypothetical protein